MQNTAIIRIHCPDQRGIVANVTDFINRHNGNILYLDQHTDRAEERFFMRVEWDLDGFAIAPEKLQQTFEEAIATPMQMVWTLNFSSQIPRMAIFVSRASHCLYDLLARYSAGELNVEIPLIISNHKDLEQVANQFDIPYFHLSLTKDNKPEVEAEQIRLCKEYKVDFIVLARYMQILSSEFNALYPNRIINIHHSFLPAFAGAKPYHAAHSRGVKLIGATGHYVTSDLDAGPIIEQDVIKISHHDTVQSLVQKGKDVEKMVLSRAVQAHIDRKTLVYKNKTIIFA
ncbi:formyltetrahydrofolate deformylase [Carboxylicivirga sediminis]|uniref:Formyltetrahydrofolate deformylase n=1 Tax=Carboxylicivirga sediminis TaxID=2006564 RepID=A0A941F6A6_9BACT|nr:formyltetrahydrofolate deformylase [Carboxylicivirga sediminis]MBR8536485.1 formyltetrahydrofolate deformylase [Carboxylicivirga sediminis]